RLDAARLAAAAAWPAARASATAGRLDIRAKKGRAISDRVAVCGRPLRAYLVRVDIRPAKAEAAEPGATDRTGGPLRPWRAVEGEYVARPRLTSGASSHPQSRAGAAPRAVPAPVHPASPQ